MTLTLGGVVASLVLKAVGKVGEKSAEAAVAVLGKLLERVRSHFRSHGNDADEAALARIGGPRAGPKQIEALATAVDRHAGSDPAFKADLQRLVREASAAGLDVQRIAKIAWGNRNVQLAQSLKQIIWGNQNVQLGTVTDSGVNVTYGSAPGG